MRKNLNNSLLNKSRNNASKLTIISKDQDPSNKLSSSLGDTSRSLDAESSTKQSRQKDKSRKELAAELDYIKKNGVTHVKLRMKILFTGVSQLAARMDRSLSTLDDCLVSINLENSLMSDRQMKELNPITIRLSKLTNMPNKPHDYSELKTICEPVYCCYKFFDQPLFKTVSLPHEKDIFFNDTNVYLAGLFDEEKLIEFLNGKHFEIEIHDRNRKKLTALPETKPSLFGNEENDKNISNINSITSKHTIHNPFTTNSEFWVRD